MPQRNEHRTRKKALVLPPPPRPNPVILRFQHRSIDLPHPHRVFHHDKYHLHDIFSDSFWYPSSGRKLAVISFPATHSKMVINWREGGIDFGPSSSLKKDHTFSRRKYCGAPNVVDPVQTFLKLSALAAMELGLARGSTPSEMQRCTESDIFTS